MLGALLTLGLFFIAIGVGMHPVPHRSTWLVWTTGVPCLAVDGHAVTDRAIAVPHPRVAPRRTDLHRQAA